MKRTIGMTVLAMVFLACIPAIGFSYPSEIDYTIPTGDFNEYLLTKLSKGTYTVSLSDDSDDLYYNLIAYILEDDNTYGNFLGKISLGTANPVTFATANAVSLGGTNPDNSLTFDLEIDSKVVFEIVGWNFGNTATIAQNTAVPVPATFILLGSGLFALTALKRRNLL